MKFTSSICASLLVLGLSAEVQAASLGNVLIIGDSVTQASGGVGKEGYRYDLWETLIRNDYTFDYVGSRDTYSQDANYTPASITHNGTTFDFDKDHEGSSGFTTTDINNRVDFLTSSNIITGASAPDTAIILLGFNDVLRPNQGTASDTITRLESIIGKVKSTNADVDIFVGSLYEFDFARYKAIDPSNRDVVDQENIYAGINNQLLNSSFATDNGVTVVNLDTGFIDPLDPTHLFDGIHPGDAGDAFIAGQFFNAIDAANVTAVPAPAAVWLLGSALIGLFGTRKKAA